MASGRRCWQFQELCQSFDNAGLVSGGREVESHGCTTRSKNLGEQDKDEVADCWVERNRDSIL